MKFCLHPAKFSIDIYPKQPYLTGVIPLNSYFRGDVLPACPCGMGCVKGRIDCFIPKNLTPKRHQVT